MLYLVGLGLGDEKDITVRGLEVVRSCDVIYLEAYTSVLGVDKDRLEAFYEKEITLADRGLVETEADELIVERARDANVAFLVVGDPFGATTHSDLVLRAKQTGVPYEVIHNASIMNAVGCSGLQLYKFGEAVSIVFFSENWRPDSFYDKIKSNVDAGLHTLCLLDIKTKEPDYDRMVATRSREEIYLPPRFMSVNLAVEQLLEIEERRKEGALSPETLAVGCARVGQPTQQLVFGTLAELLDVDFGAPLHTLILCGEMHFLEEDFVRAMFGVGGGDDADGGAAAGEDSAAPSGGGGGDGGESPSGVGADDSAADQS